MNLRAALSLGARFDIVDDPTKVSDDKAVAYTQWLVNDRLRLDGRILKKISAHMDIYGNAYVHIRRDKTGVPDKLTILQPERLKIFLDPLTTKILFYIYLPPIIGGTVLTPYPYERPNPNLIQNIALTYPTPIIIPVEDCIHLKQSDYTEYPFGFSLLRACMEPAQARLDYTILSPIIYKHYSKPLIHWKLDPTDLNPGQIKGRMNTLKSQLEAMEPTSDLITTSKWDSTTISGVSKGFSAAMDMIADSDTQIFAAMGVPETYFKPRGTTDRMVSEQDKVFIKTMKDRQEYFAEELKHKLIYPALRAHFGYSEEETPRIKIQWRKMIMTDDSIEIQNAIAMLQMGIIDMEEARRRLGLSKTVKQAQDDTMKAFVESDTEKTAGKVEPQAAQRVAQPQQKHNPLQTLFMDKMPELPPLPTESDTPLLQRPGETTEAYNHRLESMYQPRNTTPTDLDSEFADAVHMHGPAKIRDTGSSVSAKKCPYCRKMMFVGQDGMQTTYRCPTHGFIDI